MKSKWREVWLENQLVTNYAWPYMHHRGRRPYWQAMEVTKEFPVEEEYNSIEFLEDD